LAFHPIERLTFHQDIADQFQQNSKLPWLHWIFPNAKENRDARATAWYHPNKLSPRVGDEEAEDEAGMLETVAYIESLIDACVSKGIPPQRIVLGGFSQGCAMSLLTDLTSSKYAGRLAGIVGLMGYLPLCDRLPDLRAKAGLPATHGDVPIFLAKGKQDQMIPKRVWEQCLKGLSMAGVEESSLMAKEYEGVGHSISGGVLMDLCQFLERVVPDLGE
jgi:predicted esterase